MVYIPERNHRDSISFNLDPGFGIYALSAQELERYVFQGDQGRLVLFIEEKVGTGEQLYISLAYSGFWERD